ncbi:hypothetical protein SOVF_092390 [Spinacia oleracea]|nr:hypothetical protein SOVF_092390 [Spinacia oleracea]
MWQTWKSPGIIACSTLVEGLRTSGNIEDELRLDVKMLKEGVLLDSVTFNYLLQDDTRVGRPVEAYKLRLLASSKGEPFNMFSSSMKKGIAQQVTLEQISEGLGELSAYFSVRLNTHQGITDGLFKPVPGTNQDDGMIR